MGSYAIIQLLFGLCGIAVGIFGLLKMLKGDPAERTSAKMAVNLVALLVGAYLAIDGFLSL